MSEQRMPIPCEELFREYVRLNSQHEIALHEYFSFGEPGAEIVEAQKLLDDHAVYSLYSLQEAASQAYARWIECVESGRNELETSP
jgi:hypothetical protein